MPSALDKLKPFEVLFVSEYLSNRNNGTQAYLIAKPGVKSSTAGTESSKLLNNPKIQDYIQERVQGGVISHESKTNKILDRFDESYELAKKEKQCASMIAANKESGLIQGVYGQDGSESQYIQAITNIFKIDSVQVNQQTNVVPAGKTKPLIDIESDQE